MLLLSAACKHDGDNWHNASSDAAAQDIVHGLLFHVVDADNLEGSLLRLGNAESITFSSSDSDLYGFERVDEGGVPHLMARRKAEQHTPCEVVTLTVTPDNDAELSRNVVVIFRKATERGESSELSCSALGCGTMECDKLGNTTHPVFDMTMARAINSGLVTIEPRRTEYTTFEASGLNYEELLATLNRQAGLHGSKRGPLPMDVGAKVVRSEAYEYYMNLTTAVTGLATMDAAEWDGGLPTKLTAALNPDFLKDMQAAEFDASAFVAKWGTAFISSATLGGQYLYIYGRKENAYEYPVGVDAVVRADEEWQEFYAEQNSDFAIDSRRMTSYMDDDYFEASHAVTVIQHSGGDASVDEPEEWIESVAQKPAIATYNSDDARAAGLYHYGDFIKRVAMAYRNTFDGEMSAGDKMACARIEQLSLTIEEAVEALKQEQSQLMEVKRAVVLADMVMRCSRKESPRPFVAQSPHDKHTRLIYFPMRANIYAIDDYGEAFDSAIYNNRDNESDIHEYWYYALAATDDCNGLTDIRFSSEETPAAEGYVRRGDAGAESGCHLWVKPFDAARDDGAMRITAAGIADRNIKVNNIITSTGGADLFCNASEEDITLWEIFWNNCREGDTIWGLPTDAINPHLLHAVCTTKALPTPFLNDSNVSHPHRRD